MKQTTPIIVCVCVTALILFSVRIFGVSGGSMEPTFHEGERVVVDALTWRAAGVHRNDVIVFTNPHNTGVIDIKRVIGLPGESVHIKGGEVSVTHADGTNESFAQGTSVGGEANGGDYSIKLGPEDYFVLGDNRSKSTDSRSFGAVQPLNIIGRVALGI